jgi:hypothetical protein
MKNDLKSSAIENVEKFAKTLKMVNEDLIKYGNYKTSLETKILDFCEIYGIENDELSSISVQNVPFKEKIPLVNLFGVFPNLEIMGVIENLVVEIDIDLDATAENLRFSGDLQEPIIKNIIKQLEKLNNKTIKKVVVK